MNEENIKKYPIYPFLDEICQNLHKSPTKFLILTAETAAGKSTFLPLKLLQSFSGKIIMTEPRRLAALGVANRVSDLLEEECGKTVGYKVHLEKCTSSETRMEIVTEAVLIKQLQKNPALEDYNLVVIDEFHERSVNTDLALAFLKEAMLLRDDLFVIIMSATIDTEKLQKYLGTETAIMKIPGRLYNVNVSYNAKDSIEKVILNEVNTCSPKGKLLVFLPGISDIRKTYEKLSEKMDANEIGILHSSISLNEQKRILQNPPKVILSSAIAETSLTVPGVECVIDSGLARVSRMNIETGMQNLCTETESEFSACQRAGRAGREKEGKCVRMWSQSDLRIREMPPEILRTDLADLVLECTERGVSEIAQIEWLDKPNEAAWNSSVQLLKELSLLNENGTISEKGKNAIKLGMHPRLACIAIETGDLELVLKYSEYAKATPERQKRFISDLQNRLNKMPFQQKSEQLFTKGEKLLFGFPDRLAKRISEIGQNPAEYQFPSGRKSLVYDCKNDENWIVAPVVQAGKKQGVIYEFDSISDEKAQKWIRKYQKTREICKFVDKKIQKLQEICYGEIVLETKKLAPSAQDYAFAWCNEVKNLGIECLPLSKEANKFLERATFYFQENRKDIDLYTYLKNKVNEWLPPFLSDNNINEQKVYDSLYWFLEGSEIDKEVPPFIILKNGKKVKINYEKVSAENDKTQLQVRPVIEIIIQRIFGCFETPKICGKKVLLRLLSPANRPLQVTDDLENFWTGAWPEICKEMKGRYPKHNWNYKISDEEN